MLGIYITMKFILLFLLLAAPAAAQTRVNVPQIDYSKYGSLSRQMTVFRNVQNRVAYNERRLAAKRAAAQRKRIADRLRLLRHYESNLTRRRTHVGGRRIVVIVGRVPQ